MTPSREERLAFLRAAHTEAEADVMRLAFESTEQAKVIRGLMADRHRLIEELEYAKTKVRSLRRAIDRLMD